LKKRSHLFGVAKGAKRDLTEEVTGKRPRDKVLRGEKGTQQLHKKLGAKYPW